MADSIAFNKPLLVNPITRLEAQSHAEAASLWQAAAEDLKRFGIRPFQKKDFRVFGWLP